MAAIKAFIKVNYMVIWEQRQRLVRKNLIDIDGNSTADYVLTGQNLII